MTGPIHLLHIGKTGGSALKVALGEVGDDTILRHTHRVRLIDIPPGHRVTFSVRDPFSRFVSAFNSRLRKGRPRYDSDWNAAEAEAFRDFPTPNALAEALDAGGPRQAGAASAMRAIRHVNAPLARWLGSPAALEERRDDIFLVLFQATLAEDFERLKSLLDLPNSLMLPSDPVASHATPTGFSQLLTSRARANLRCWFANDLELYRFLRAWAPALGNVERAR